jgi:hypothetical protein
VRVSSEGEGIYRRRRCASLSWDAEGGRRVWGWRRRWRRCRRLVMGKAAGKDAGGVAAHPGGGAAAGACVPGAVSRLC